MRLFSLSKIFLIKSAAKEDVLKEKYPEFADKVDFYLDKDPTPNKKYVEWMLKQLSLGHPESEVLYFTDYFHRHNSILSSKDLNSYSFEKLKSEFGDIRDEIRQKELRKKRRDSFKSALSEKIYDSDRFVVYRADDRAACEKHGLGTKWCITTSDPDDFTYRAYFFYSSRNYKHYFIVDKYSKEKELLSKIVYTLGKNHKEIHNSRGHGITDDVVKDYAGEEFNDIYNAMTNDYAKHTTTKEHDNLNSFISENTSNEEWLRVFSDKNIRYYLKDFEKRKLSEDTIKYLIDNGDNIVIANMLEHQQLSENMLRYLAENGDDTVKAMISFSYRDLDADLLKHLVENGGDEVKKSISLFQPNLPIDIIKYLLKYGDDDTVSILKKKYNL